MESALVVHDAAQPQFIDDFRAAGGDAVVAEGIDQALRVLEGWQLLCGTAKTN